VSRRLSNIVMHIRGEIKERVASERRAAVVSALEMRTGTPLDVPLAFMLTGLVAAVLFALAAPVLIPLALIDPQDPHVLALVHVVTLGWVTMTVMGVLYQLVPVLLGGRLPWPWLARAQFAGYVIGVTLLIGGFWFWRPPLLATGGSLVVTAVGVFIGHLVLTIRRAKRHGLVAAYLYAALTYLAATVTLGLLMALNFAFGFWGPWGDLLLRPHLLIGISGWLTLTILGVSYRLVPMFAMVRRREDRGSWMGFGLINIGLVLVALAVGLGGPEAAIWAGAVFFMVGLAWFGRDYIRMLRARVGPPPDATMRLPVVALCYLVVAVIGAVVQLIWPGIRSQEALIYLLLIGWVGQSIVGYFHKILPFVIWNARYSGKQRDSQAPSVQAMVQPHLAMAVTWLLPAGVAATAVSIRLGSVPAIKASSALVAIAMLLFAMNVLRMLSL
jgi:hypothetical protein